MRRVRLLIADDDQEVREWLRLVLQALPAAVAEASDGAELLEALLGDRVFDVVVTDIRMPRRSGLDAALQARQAGCALPFIFISGFKDEETLTAVRGLGRAVLLVKPVDVTELLDRIRELLAEQPDPGRRSRGSKGGAS